MERNRSLEQGDDFLFLCDQRFREAGDADCE
jgi:hypothetical protein